MSETTPELADHVRQTVEEIARVHEEHYRGADWLQRATDRVTDILGRPTFLATLLAALLAWIVGNAWLHHAGRMAADPPPYVGLELAATLAALVLAILILATQRREDRLARQRSQLTLELAMLSEKKTAKIIALLEELRRDSPNLDDRDDPESEAMSSPADARAVLSALEERGPDKTD